MLTLSRRGFAAALALASAAAALPLSKARAAGTWRPDHPIHLILPYAPGGATDVIGRPWADALGRAFGQPFVVDNRGGASGTIGTEAAARSAADGYTLLLAPNSALTLVPQLRQVGYDPQRDLVPVARVGDLIAGFVVNNSVPVNSMKELVAYAKAHPGKLFYGSAGLGTSSQMRLEVFKMVAGVDITHVPYGGSAAALNDLLANNVQMMNEINVIPQVRAGKLKLLAVNYPTRHPDFPDVPTLTEAGYPGADVPIWYALYAPTGTPEAVLETLNATVNRIAATPEMIARMRAINVAVPQQDLKGIAAMLKADVKANAEVIHKAKIKLS